MSMTESAMAAIMDGGLTPEQIYQALTTGPGVETLSAAHATAGDHAALHRGLAELLREQTADMAENWRGEAGMAAADPARATGQLARETARSLEVAERLFAAQSELYLYARNTVVPMPPNPGVPDFVGVAYPMLLDVAAQAEAYRQAAEINKSVYEEYHRGSDEIGARVPADYGKPPGERTP